MIITVYRIDSGFSNVADGLTLTPPPSGCIYSTDKYELPGGYTIKDSDFDTMTVYDPAGKACDLCLNNLRGTAIFAVSCNGMKALKKVNEHTPDSLRDLRAKAGLTQQQLADASGVNIRQLQRVEGGDSEIGNLTLRNAVAIADALGVDVRNLL
jgi:DNA-binding XRE family transcriptional regulator